MAARDEGWHEAGAKQLRDDALDAHAVRLDVTDPAVVAEAASTKELQDTSIKVNAVCPDIPPPS